MSKLHQKFMISISFILLLVIGASLLINNRFVERVYLYRQKTAINTICNNLIKQPEARIEIAENAEESLGIIIVFVDNTGEINSVNKALRMAFLDKGFGLERYWMWEQDYKTAIREGTMLRIYNQPTLPYSLLVGYVKLDKHLAAVAMIVPDTSEMIGLINLVTSTVFFGAAVLILGILFILLQQITKPIDKMCLLTQDIGNGNFRKMKLRTGDELEILAGHINMMSEKLEEAQQHLLEKNRQMEDLLNNVSHDLKTPISLIKAYVIGMQDGMDDGTFLDVILRQNGKMEHITAQLLQISGINAKVYAQEEINLKVLINKILADYSSLLRMQKILVTRQLKDVAASANRECMEIIIVNLLVNAIKYSADHKIFIFLKEQDSMIFFAIENEISNGTSLNTDRIWEAFYVGETSRNNAFSGTGLGLSIVRAAAQKQGTAVECIVTGNHICFQCLIPKSTL